MENDDKATIVLDFNKLKEQLNSDEDLVDSSSLDFISKNLEIDADELKASPQIKESSESIIMLDYNSDFFANKFGASRTQTIIVTELGNLNELLRANESNILAFYYNSAPKVINQLIIQIKEKFPKNKMIVIATNLSRDKALTHKKTKFGVDVYLSDPFELTEFFEKIEKL